MKETLIIFCGIHSLSFAIFHAFFWKLFKWKDDLQRTSLASRAIIQIANLRLIYIFLFISFLCFFMTHELLSTSLGKVFLIGISLFWFGRTVEQFIFFKHNNKLVVILTVLFIAGFLLFLLPVFL